jgi:hypothetical protein
MDQVLRILSAIEAATTWDPPLGKLSLEHFLEVAGLVARATEEPDLPRGPLYDPKNARIGAPMGVHCGSLAYLCNIFHQPIIKGFFEEKGIALYEDLHALSEMLQWLWRSQSANSANLYAHAGRSGEDRIGLAGITIIPLEN